MFLWLLLELIVQHIKNKAGTKNSSLHLKPKTQNGQYIQHIFNFFLFRHLLKVIYTVWKTCWCFQEHRIVLLLHLLARSRNTPVVLLERFDDRFGLTLAHAISASMSAGMSPQLFFCCSWASPVVSHSCRAALSFWNFWDRDRAFSRSCLPSVTWKENEY